MAHDQIVSLSFQSRGNARHTTLVMPKARDMLARRMPDNVQRPEAAFHAAPCT
jgi:hypothetical protein